MIGNSSNTVTVLIETTNEVETFYDDVKTLNTAINTC
jgi:hypothetical protein